jgi:hypothetical protein
MAILNAQDIFNELAKYYGLSKHDEYLNKTVGSNPVSTNESATSTSSKSRFYNEILGGAASDFARTSSLMKLLDGYGSGIENDVRITSHNDPENGKVPSKARNKKSDQQGSGDPKRDDTYMLAPDINVKNPMSVFQIFPASKSTDATDTDVIALFMNSITTLQMSRAIPFLDVAISTKNSSASENRFDRPPSLSLGRFLGAGNGDYVSNAKFVNNQQTTITSNEKLQTVASMEVFTSPQTMVNSSNVKYNESVGGPVDAFRPFMNINNISISVTPTGYGLITKKMAKLSLTLFDRGRLGDISELVSPQRNGSIQFLLTWGWSHPDGSMSSRQADAKTDRLGQLINVMKVTESFVVVNTSYSLQPDGSMQIDLDMASTPLANSSDNDLDIFAGNTTTLKVITNVLEGINKNIKIAQEKSSIPKKINEKLALIPDDADGFLMMSNTQKESLAELQKELTKQGSTNLNEVKKHLESLIGKKGSIQSFKASRRTIINNFLRQLETTPDPFFRKCDGVPACQKRKNDLNDYVTFGKLLCKLLDPLAERDDAEVQIVFGAFNENAAGMFDHNISQFPLKIRGDNSLESALNDLSDKRGSSLSLNDILAMIAGRFFRFDGSAAYGLSGLYALDQRDKEGNPKLTAQAERNKEKKDLNVILVEELKNIYASGRIKPDFRQPDVAITMTSKPARTTGTAGDKKNVLRVLINDRAGSGMMPFMQAYASVLDTNTFLDNDYTGPGASPISARHNDSYQKIIEQLKNRKLVNSLSSYLKDSKSKPDSIDQVRWDKTYVLNFSQAGKSLRNILFEFSPVLIYGSETSGIINASLNSQQNDSLLNINLVKTFGGAGDNGFSTRSENLPRFVMPTQLKLTTFGCPFFTQGQKFFIDFGTFTTADNFYAVTSVNHTISAGDFKTDIELVQIDAYGKFINITEEVESQIIQSIIAAASK